MLNLPESCGSRESANQLFANLTDPSPFINLTNVMISQGYADQMCKIFIEKRIDSVVFINATEKFQTNFLKAHRLRGGKFIVEFNTN